MRKMSALKFTSICIFLAESVFCLVFPGKVNTENSVMDLDFSPVLKSKLLTAAFDYDRHA